jgi:putative transposase
VARPLRANFKNGWYHVTTRGNNRQRIFFDEQDRRHFLEMVGQMIERQAVRKYIRELVRVQDQA